MYLITVLYSMRAGNGEAFMNLDLRTLVMFGAKFRPAILVGQWWRLLTAGYLHGGLFLFRGGRSGSSGLLIRGIDVVDIVIPRLRIRDRGKERGIGRQRADGVGRSRETSAGEYWSCCGSPIGDGVLFR